MNRTSLLRCAFALGFALLGTGQSALADPAITHLEITTTPTLVTAAEEGGNAVLAASPGVQTQLSVVAHRDDGSSEDVSSHSSTTFISLDPSVSVDASGALSFASPGPAERTAAIMVSHAGASRILVFVVSP